MTTLPRLAARFPIVDSAGRPTIQFQSFFQTFAAEIEATLNLLNLVNSTPTGCTITAADVGATATATISAHTRVYGDGVSVAVGGGTVTGLAFSTIYFIYYDDAGRDGGAVTYQAATAYADACPSQSAPNRHFVGAVTTPANGDPPSDGEPATAPGWGGQSPIP